MTGKIYISFDDTLIHLNISLSPGVQSQQRVEWARELSDLDTEIQELEERLRVKMRHAQTLKRSLGVTAWREFSDDIREGMKRLQESPTYIKLEAELANLAVRVEEGAVSVGIKAGAEMRKATFKTSAHLASAHKRLSQKLENIGVIEPPREYRKDDVEPVIQPSSNNSASSKAVKVMIEESGCELSMENDGP